ncbi:ABC transporter ATP-binding protein [Actinoplanes sichuanensis]|uniref:ABC transporter ATP-binding protein n=1 Tax=Actinoplanes sichuanensis TaxID=512349 RepID=A0ABW4ANR9_9ACTN|nr:ABC transporter ATP-binding protein [Actinoplanes sichuanensis]BEL08287.1 ABC transporter ATP-binding protein [Actinoplanes sichuanensis]
MTPLRSLLPYLRPHRAAIAGVIVIGLCAAAAGLALPLVARQLVDGLSERRPVLTAVVLLVALTLTTAVLNGVGAYLQTRAAEGVVLRVRQALVAHLTRLRVTVLDHDEPGDLTARVTSDSTLLRSVVTETLVGGITGTFMLAGVLVLMGAVDPVLLAVCAATMGVAGLFIGAMTRQVNRSSAQAQEAIGAVGARLERMFGGFRTVKACGAEQREEADLLRAVTRLRDAGVRAGAWSAGATSTVEIGAQTAFLVVLAVGGARVASGDVGIGTLVAFLLYVFMLVPPVSQVVQALVGYQTAAAGAARITRLLALPAEPLPRTAGPAATGRVPAAAVGFDDVHFRYGPQARVVHRGLSFDIPPLGVTAFVGASGEGKTTVFSLLERFHDVESGRVTVAGRDVRDWPLDRLRAIIGYVEQDAPGLSGTLRSNLLYGAPHAGEAELRSVLRLVRLDATVDRLPLGLDSPVGHRGARFSGGERQRLAIARALLRRPGLLLLDEATSQLDAVNEAALRDTVAEIAEHSTVLVVAHRLSTVTAADRIVVLDGGRVRAVGTHADLLREDALYADLAATQLLHAGPGARTG